MRNLSDSIILLLSKSSGSQEPPEPPLTESLSKEYTGHQLKVFRFQLEVYVASGYSFAEIILFAHQFALLGLTDY